MPVAGRGNKLNRAFVIGSKVRGDTGISFSVYALSSIRRYCSPAFLASSSYRSASKTGSPAGTSLGDLVNQTFEPLPIGRSCEHVLVLRGCYPDYFNLVIADPINVKLADAAFHNCSLPLFRCCGLSLRFGFHSRVSFCASAICARVMSASCAGQQF